MGDNGQAAGSAADYDDDQPIETLQKDLEQQMRRLRQIASQDEVDPRTALTELHGTVLPLMRDILPYIVRLEDHAAWASETIEYLSTAVSGDDETSSQLAPVDAAKFKAFLSALIQSAEADVARFGPEGSQPDTEVHDRAESRLQQSRELLAIVEEITLEDPDADPDDDDAPSAAAQSESDAAGAPGELRAEE